MDKAIDYNKILANSERASAQAYVTLSLSDSCSVANDRGARDARIRRGPLYNGAAIAIEAATGLSSSIQHCMHRRSSA
jgi:hypothetical protein